MDHFQSDKNFIEIRKWMQSILSKNSYKVIECFAECFQGGSFSVNLVAKKDAENVLFVDMDPTIQKSLESLMGLKLKTSPNSHCCYFTLVIESPNKAKKVELLTDQEKSQIKRAEILKQDELGFPKDLFEDTLINLLVEVLGQYGRVSRCYDPKEDCYHSIWQGADKIFHVGESYRKHEEKKSIFSFSTEKEFVDWLTSQSPHSLYKQGVPWKKGELIEAIRMVPYIQSKLP